MPDAYYVDINIIIRRKEVKRSKYFTLSESEMNEIGKNDFTIICIYNQ